ncbi:MAG: PH domain-containing protein [Nanoarchaeota archaeon]
MERLHLGAKWQFRVGGYFLFGFFGIFFGIWVIAPIVGFLFTLTGSSASSILVIILLSILGYILFVIVASEIYARMSYNRWFYEFNDDGLKLERGIIWKRYSNVPYQRIQNVDVRRGIIARMFGFSSIMIQTAGYSAQLSSEGYIPAVETNQAEKIRAFVMKKITRKK